MCIPYNSLVNNCDQNMLFMGAEYEGGQEGDKANA